MRRVVISESEMKNPDLISNDYFLSEKEVWFNE